MPKRNDDVKLTKEQVELREARDKAGISRSQLANRLGIHMRTLVRWERAERGLNDENYERAMREIKNFELGAPERFSGPQPVRIVQVPVEASQGPQKAVEGLSEVPLVDLAREVVRRLENL